MLTRLLKAKLHHAIVTFTDLNYPGSVTIDSQLLARSGLLPNEAVLIADCENGNRFETYIIPGEPGSGMIGINGAAARLTAKGNRVIIMSFILAEPHEIAGHKARVLVMDKANKVSQVLEH
jgi:aspartate 1-decarboxylase